MLHIAILDFGSQYTHLIARRARELGVLAKIYLPDVAASDLPDDVCGIILSGGPQSVYDENALTIDATILGLGKPILGLCYGHQLLAHLLGGEVEPGKVREYGRAALTINKPSSLLTGLDSRTTVWMSHGDMVSKLPPGFEVIGATDDCPVAAMADEKQQIFGLQFHPEIHHTARGQEILKNFVFNVCGAEPNWRIDDLLADIIIKIKNQVGGKNVFLLVSGGVDSTVCFALLEKALGKKRVFGLHVDTGFMRQDESKEIVAALAQAGYDNLHVVDASKTFYKRLRGIADPEQKRKIIGQTFLDVKDEAAGALKLNPNEWLLAQGTIYPDTIETGGTKHADRIKTHHNRVDAIQELLAAGKIIEPLADFYKDEVRQLGRLLGLSTELTNRHPFPGPGLAIRVLCQQKPPLLSEERVGVRSGEAIRTTQDHPTLTLPSPWKGEGINHILLPIKSVGVQGDNRTYAHPIAIWYNPPLPANSAGLPERIPSSARRGKGVVRGGWEWDKLDDISRQITNSNRNINRVLLLLNPDYPRHSEAAAGGRMNLVFKLMDNRALTLNRVELLRQIDAMVTEEIKAAGLYNTLWQCPVVLIPLGRDNKESIVLRPVVSQEAMTANFARLPADLIANIVKNILSTNLIAYIFYDITNKPPGTIEWE